MVREELISSADPSVAASPVEKRVAFLQSKNLTKEEIDVALSRTGEDPSAAAVVTSSSGYQPAPQQAAYRPFPPPGPGYGYPPYGQWQPPPEPPQRDWRDWFIMATVVGGVGYGLYSITKRYITPLIAPPTPPQLEQDKEHIDEEFNRAFALIDQLSTDTAALKSAEEARTERLDAALREVENLVSDMKNASRRRDDETRRISDEVKSLKDAIPKALEGAREGNETRLKELGSELKSLKVLLGNRLGSGSNGASSPTPGRFSGMSLPTATASRPVEESSPAASGTTNGAPSALPEQTPPPAQPSPSASTTSLGNNNPLSQFSRSASIPAWQMAAANRSKTASPSTASTTSPDNSSATATEPSAPAKTKMSSRDPHRTSHSYSHSHSHSRTRSRSRSRSPNTTTTTTRPDRHRTRHHHHHHHHDHDRQDRHDRHRAHREHRDQKNRSSQQPTQHAAPPAPITLPFQARELRKRDLAHYTPMFDMYLDIQKGIFLDDLSEEELKGRWKSFVGKWNRGELAEGWYDPSTLEKARQNLAEMQAQTQRENESAEDTIPVGRQSDRPDAEDNDDDDDDDEYGPVLPGGHGHGHCGTGGFSSGPTIPTMQDLELRKGTLTYLPPNCTARAVSLSEDALAARQDSRSLHRGELRSHRAEVRHMQDEVAPRAEPGTHERRMEKRQEATAANRAFAEAKRGGSPEAAPEEELMGSGENDLDALKNARAREQRKKNEREIRKEEIMRARAEEREERLRQYRQKEDKTIGWLKTLAKQRFG
ncbi:hypothetical protein BO70DRAFT_281812 [Aspergillus heteromorphus CBS 117.55]|uniref:Peroxisomal membrane protein PEX14 n=1 Tax=Aspergillus heteromorphus CBS 117.55 TaxID=1448321 RepID=A0A317X2P2_9EURO|nr:uncharacterized protein BO70DRAFT_281812 [Aspergillus heteromorphus CBS 117.55]PWY92615.1 hypothetical protein BO70DRAFT_281812 [Aspergillus heteromorphus CBS 117.55]